MDRRGCLTEYKRPGPLSTQREPLVAWLEAYRMDGGVPSGCKVRMSGSRSTASLVRSDKAFLVL